jgi:hypothetical protein
MKKYFEVGTLTLYRKHIEVGTMHFSQFIGNGDTTRGQPIDCDIRGWHTVCEVLPPTATPATIEQGDEVSGGIININYSLLPLHGMTWTEGVTQEKGGIGLAAYLSADIPFLEIMQAAWEGSLIISCDGGYDQKSNQATYSWVFQQQIVIFSKSNTAMPKIKNYIDNLTTAPYAYWKLRHCCISSFAIQP